MVFQVCCALETGEYRKRMGFSGRKRRERRDNLKVLLLARSRLRGERFVAVSTVTIKAPVTYNTCATFFLCQMGIMRNEK